MHLLIQATLSIVRFTRLRSKNQEPEVPTTPMSPTKVAALEVSRQKEVTANLVELFREVDINGDGDMEWDEFTRFIVEKVSVGKRSNLILDPNTNSTTPDPLLATPGFPLPGCPRPRENTPLSAQHSSEL